VPKSVPSRRTSAEAQRVACGGAAQADAITFDFAGAFESDPLEGVRRLADLLRDPVNCETRCAFIEGLSASAIGNKIIPGAPLSDEGYFLRELVWIAQGNLWKAASKGLTTPERVAQLTSHPKALRLAGKCLWDGIEVLQCQIRRNWAETWHWMRELIVSGELVAVRKESVVGRHVAAWGKEHAIDEFIVADSAVLARREAAEKWVLPEEMIAVSFVDGH
jgi:hypothetical protein